MIVQVYAFTDAETAVTAAELGVDQIGFVAGHYAEKVPCELDFAEARRLVEALPSTARSVALTMSAEVDEILRMAESVHPDYVHVSTDPFVVGLDAMTELRRCLPDSIKLMKAIPVGGLESVQIARDFAEVSDVLLLDTKVSGLPGVGVTGRTHDWKISRQIVESISIPVILAGGLSPQNVAEAIRVVQPWGVDSNTATNLPNDPEKKDLACIAAFVQSARGATYA